VPSAERSSSPTAGSTRLFAIDRLLWVWFYRLWPRCLDAMVLVKPALWDNSNIIESYSGVTTSLTFSFARKAYENVYRELLLGSVPRS
jgi:hypothetical protein